MANLRVRILAHLKNGFYLPENIDIFKMYELHMQFKIQNILFYDITLTQDTQFLSHT